jgi:hypothetical protein
VIAGGPGMRWLDLGLFVAQSDSAEQAGRLFRSIAPWLAVLLLVVVIGGIVMTMIRRAMKQESSSQDAFSLQALRDLHAKGDLTDDEFARAKQSMVGRTVSGSDKARATPTSAKPKNPLPPPSF